MIVSKKQVKFEFDRLSAILKSRNFLLWDTVDEEIVTKIEPFGFGSEFGLRINQVVLYSSDSSIDNGYFDTKEEFLKKIGRYKTIPVPDNPELVEIIKKLSR